MECAACGTSQVIEDAGDGKVSYYEIYLRDIPWTFYLCPKCAEDIKMGVDAEKPAGGTGDSHEGS